MILACSSHLLIDLPLFGGPVLLVAGAIGAVSWMERHREDEDDEAFDAAVPAWDA